MRLVTVVKRSFTPVLSTLFLLLCSSSSNAQCDAPTGLSFYPNLRASNSFTIYWDNMPSAVKYEYALTNSATPPASGTQINAVDEFGNRISSTNLLYTATGNYVHIRSICASSNSAWTTKCFSIPSSLAGTDTYCYGQSASIGMPTVEANQTYRWWQEGGALVKQITVPPDGGGSSQSYLLSVNDPQDAGTYYVTTEKSGCTETSFGNVIIKYSYPYDLTQTSINHNSASFSWNNNVINVQYQYTLYDVNFNYINSGSTYDKFLTLTGLTPNNSYKLEIAAGCTSFNNSLNGYNLLSFTTLGALPVKMEFFKAKNVSNTNILNWKSLCAGSVSSKINFSVERSEDGTKFNPIHSFTTTYERCLQPFEFADKTISSQVNYYRIKVTDETGKVTYSSILKLDNKISKPAFNIFPNPIKESSVLQLQLNTDAKINVSIHDVSGRLLQNVIDGVNYTNGTHQLTLNTASLSSGIYLCKVLIDGKDLQVIKLVKQ